MPRNPDGTYDLPNPDVAPGEVISSAWANSTMNDIAATLEDSLDRDGNGGMRAPLQFGDGTVSLPGITWAAEVTTGMYRAGVGDMRVSILGTDVFRWNNGNAQVWTGSAWATVLIAGSEGSVPDGTAAWQTMTWNNSLAVWEATSALTTNATSGAVSAALFVEGGTQLPSKYLGITATAVDSAQLGGENGTFYQNSGNQSAGILPRPRLDGTYDIDITGSAGTAGGTADDSLRLGGELPAYYTNSSNQDAGTLPVARLSAVTPYNIDITGNAATATLAATATEAANADTVDGWNIVVGGSGPGTDPQTLYFRTS